MKFHNRVPSFSFTRAKHDNENEAGESSSQPSTPFRADFNLSSHLSPTHLPGDLDPIQVQTPLTHEMSAVLSARRSSKEEASEIRKKSTITSGIRQRADSLVEGILEEGTPLKLLGLPANLKGRRGSANDAFLAASVVPPRGITRNRWSINNLNTFSRQRMRISSLFSGNHHSPSTSRSPSPVPSASRSRSAVDSDGESISEVASGHVFEQSEQDSSDSDSSTDSSGDSDDDTLDSAEDQTILANTTANASARTPIDFLQTSNQPVPFFDQAPNLTSPPPIPVLFSSSNQRRETDPKRKPSIVSRSTSRRKKSINGHQGHIKLPLVVSRPVYEKNRCTITMEHGDRAKAFQKVGRSRFYLVASDLSEESRYAIEWTIGTVLRQGDEVRFANFDSDKPGSASDGRAKIKNQKDRREKAATLVREATALLERTTLNVKVTCQAVHAKSVRRMLVDCIDFLQPNLVIVGRHGVSSTRGTLMGTVMVARRRLRIQPKVYKKRSQLNRSPRMHLNEAEIDKESQKITSPQRHDAPEDGSSLSHGEITTSYSRGESSCKQDCDRIEDQETSDTAILLNQQPDTEPANVESSCVTLEELNKLEKGKSVSISFTQPR
ncbi:uncharacterized protein MELLADRAFT_59047 [Melampsora larici-populina 98AG31]|uniref:UspA domain-containing protein n=1 Tax=Melampsora larici-populina (strain 98AG31 / pathotype 3-4-7) TaxID=747676 RepID=F4R6V5_MELLP|nr:uncharacterized protein MELLADRAFT_59047 [Melampsora larici-populina 98AG31]EGG11937.1 hypothetical protein MELLADRAFT_59047 [Melampsora larici-populina 98AG31]